MPEKLNTEKGEKKDEGLYTYFLSLGSNINYPFRNLNLAQYWIEKKLGRVVKSSFLYINEAVGFETKNWFVNQNIELKSGFHPERLIIEIKWIEKEMGRVYSKQGYEDRVIDIDILICKELSIDNENLQIPHKQLGNRPFFWLPFQDLNYELKIDNSDRVDIKKWIY